MESGELRVEMPTFVPHPAMNNSYYLPEPEANGKRGEVSDDKAAS
jgi:hypothetical protein